MAAKSSPKLDRSLTLLDVIAFGITGIIGSGIFLLPGIAAGSMGPASILAFALAGVICFLIALCFAEAGARYQSTGAAYLYARDAFGHFVGFQVGWISCVVAVLAWAALALGFTEALSRFIPALKSGPYDKIVAVSVMAVLTGVNLLGMRIGTRINTVLTGAKLIPLLIVIGVGVFFIDGGNFDPFTLPGEGYEPLANTTFFMIYAYVGFEVVAVPAGEMKNPQRSVPIALVSVMLGVMIVYLLVMTVAVGTVPAAALAGDTAPLASAAQSFLGGWGGRMVHVGVCVSIFGTTLAMAIFGPRRLYAMGERGDLPAIFAKVSPTTRVPVFSAIVFSVLAAACTLYGSFLDLAVLGVIARFLQFIPTALAVIVFRARDTAATRPGFRIPGGPIIPLVTIGLCLWLLYKEYLFKPERLEMGGYALLGGVPLYALAYFSREAARTSPAKES